MAVTINPSSSGIGAGSSSSSSIVTSFATPATGYALALRASQASNGNLIDQSPTGNVLTTNAGLFPVSWAPSSAVALNSYRTPTNLNGFIYKATAGGTNAASEPTWPTTVGGTVTSNTVTYTCEKGPFFNDTSGTRIVRTLASSQTGQASTFSLPQSAFTWDMANGQSLIINLRLKYNYTASGQANVSPILSTRETTGTNRGLQVFATGSGFDDLRFLLRGSTTEVLSDDMSLTFTRKPLDGSERNVCMMIDGILKIMYVYIDGVGLVNADMSAGVNCPNGMNLAAVTGSTQGGALTIGANPLATSSIETGYKAIDVVVRPGGLPANIQNIASWFSRGGEALLPESLFA